MVLSGKGCARGGTTTAKGKAKAKQRPKTAAKAKAQVNKKPATSSKGSVKPADDTPEEKKDEEDEKMEVEQSGVDIE